MCYISKLFENDVLLEKDRFKRVRHDKHGDFLVGFSGSTLESA